MPEPTSTYKIVASSQISEDIIKIETHLVRYLDESEYSKAFDRLDGSILEAARSLTQYPYRCPCIYKLRDGTEYRALLFDHERYRLIYRIDEDRKMVIITGVKSTKESDQVLEYFLD